MKGSGWKWELGVGGGLEVREAVRREGITRTLHNHPCSSCNCWRSAACPCGEERPFYLEAWGLMRWIPPTGEVWTELGRNCMVCPRTYRLSQRKGSPHPEPQGMSWRRDEWT